jgi:hypothetical protein
MVVLRYDDWYNHDNSDDAARLAYEADENNFSIIEMRGKQNPKNHWVAPFVTGHSYYLRWSYGLDFENARFEIIEPVWRHPQDKDIKFEMPFYDVRDAIHIDDNTGERIANQTLYKQRAYNRFGANYVYNLTDFDTTGDGVMDVENREKRLIFAVSANNDYNDDTRASRIDLTGSRPAAEDDVEEGTPGDEMFWSEPDTWPSGVVPAEGDDVEILSSMNVVYDVEGTPPDLDSLEINGILKFDDNADRELRSKRIWVRAGEWNIGTEDTPFQHKAVITLLGNNTIEYWSFASNIEAGNKNLVVTGAANFYGKPRLQTTRRRMLVDGEMRELEDTVEVNRCRLQ